ncbi:MAG: hypothetical protein U0103_24430 [Candidatus Obscuribacterales bacterium]
MNSIATSLVQHQLLSTIVVAAILGLVIGYKLAMTAWIDLKDPNLSAHVFPGFTFNNALWAVVGFAVVASSASHLAVYCFMGPCIMVGAVAGIVRDACRSSNG